MASPKVMAFSAPACGGCRSKPSLEAMTADGAAIVLPAILPRQKDCFARASGAILVGASLKCDAERQSVTVDSSSAADAPGTKSSQREKKRERRIQGRAKVGGQCHFVPHHYSHHRARILIGRQNHDDKKEEDKKEDEEKKDE
eukprot:gene410-768_t